MHYPEMSGLLLIIMLLANLCILYDHLVLDVEYPRFLLLLALTTLCAIPLWLIGWCVMYLVKYLMVRVTSETIVEKTHYVAVAPPYFDPVLGVAIRCAPAKGGDTIELQLEPAWANLFPSFPNLNQGKATEETGIVGSLYCPVKAGGEPSSVVMLKSNGVSIGMGCRLKTAEGEFLSTAMHVWQNPSKVTHMAKNGKEVEVKDWEPALGCESPELDFALIPVPSQVWAKLGVKAATLAMPSTNQVVTAYGGPSSTGLYSGVGTLKTNEFSWKLTHTAPTAKAWSGTPLYSSRGVVGMHTGYEQVCVENRAVNLYYIVNHLCRKQETELPDLHVQEISLEDVETRSYEFLEVDIIGRGKAKIGKREFAWIPSSGKYWADEEEDSLPPVPKLEDGKIRWFDSNETFYSDEHLNCQRAAGSRPLPPSLNLQATSLRPVEKLPLEVCPSASLESRFANLEKLVEKMCQIQCGLPQPLSPSLQTSPGLKEDQGLNLAPCYSKQESLVLPEFPKISKEPVNASLSATPPPIPVLPCVVKAGPSTQFSKKSARRRNRKKSTKRPALASPSPVSQPITVTS
nr:MAG: polyprotein P2a [Sobemovirus sp.]